MQLQNKDLKASQKNILRVVRLKKEGEGREKGRKKEGEGREEERKK